MTDLMNSTAKKFILRQKTVGIKNPEEPIANHDKEIVFDNPPTDKVNYGRIVAGNLSGVYKKAAKIVKEAKVSNFSLNVTLWEVMPDGTENCLVTRNFQPNPNNPVVSGLVEEIKENGFYLDFDLFKDKVRAMKMEMAEYAVAQLKILLNNMFEENPETAFIVLGQYFTLYNSAGKTVAGQNIYLKVAEPNENFDFLRNFGAHCFCRDGQWREPITGLHNRPNQVKFSSPFQTNPKYVVPEKKIVEFISQSL